MANSSQLVLPMMTPPACFEPDHGRRVVRRNVVFQQLRSAGGAHAFGDDDVFHRDGHAGQRTGIFAAREFLIHARGRGQRALGREMQIGVGLRIFGFGEAQRLAGEFGGAEAPRR